jgi:outer membrane protein OmpA-like peptidoglycan-associated protein
VAPLPFDADSPAWTRDPAIDGYIKTCQGSKAGDPINAVYADRILAAALINDATNAYNARRYRESLELYRSALRTPGGEQLRAYNGVYLASWKLKRRDEAMQAYARIVDHGLANRHLSVKFLFRPGSTQFWADAQISGPYPLWLNQIAQRSAHSKACLEIIGHTSRSGPEPLNERLSVLRAQAIKDRLEAVAAELAKRTIASGVGSRENLVGTGADDASDALDRRVEFKVIGC